MARTARNIRWAGLALAAAALVATLLPSLGSGQATGGSIGAIVFEAPGEHAFIVPAGIYWLTTEIEGGHGGSGDDIAPGGRGGGVNATIPVTPGETLRVVVGAYGGGGGGQGWAHGGDHGTADGALNDCATAAGGGGSSAVARASAALVAAGGGGGGGGDCGSSYGGAGGDGGKDARSGRNARDYEPPAVGTAGCGGCRDGHDGQSGHDATYDETGGGGGGGGGGATHGGGGGEDGTIGFGKSGAGGGGGGAGDSLVAIDGALLTSFFTSARGHHGQVTLSWGNQATRIAAAAGNGQHALIMNGFSTGLRAKVTDSRGIPAVGVDVRFAVPASGPSGTFTGGATSAVARTGIDGTAAAPPLRANAVAGEWFAVAGVAGVSPSARFALENDAATTTTALASDFNPSVTGQPVKLTASVRSSVSTAAPTGRVQFVVDGAPSGDPVVLAGGTATSPAISDLAPGDHPIEARYLGDAGHGPSTGTAPDQRVDPAPTATSVTSTLNPSGVGDTVAFEAAVIVSAPAAGTPDGTIRFARDGVPFGAQVALDASGRAVSDDVTFPVEGEVDITAEYAPAGVNPRFEGSTGALTQSVGDEVTATLLSTSVNPVAAGEPALLTAEVLRSDPGAPAEGQMTFLVEGEVVCPPAAVVNATATCALPATLAPGEHRVRAEFAGASGYDDSEGTVFQRVVRAGTRTVVSAEPDPSAYGTDLRLRAIVGVVAPGTGVPAGTVQFSVDGAAVGGPVPVDAGVALSAPVADLALGAHEIEADFAPSVRFAPSHAAATQLVTAVSTSAAIVSDAAPARAGEPIRFTATVAAAEGDARPTGSVQLLVDGGAHGAPIPLVGGRAVSAPHGDLAVGTHTVTAHYHGYGPFASSEATMQQQILAPIPSGSGSSAASGDASPAPGPGADGPGPIALTPMPTLVLRGRDARVDGRGTARLAVECLALLGQRCAGAMTLRTAEPVRLRGGAAARGTVVATRRVSLVGGEQARLALDVSRTAERMLDREPGLVVVAQVEGMAGDVGEVLLRATRAHALRVRTTQATADVGGRIRVAVQCAAPRRERCRGTVRAGGPAATATVSGGRTETVKVRLGGAERRRLARAGELRVRAEATSTLTVGLPASSARRIAVRAA